MIALDRRSLNRLKRVLTFINIAVVSIFNVEMKANNLENLSIVIKKTSLRKIILYIIYNLIKVINYLTVLWYVYKFTSRFN